ncbi:MAG TPA: phosphoserine phosphatase [Sphaerochaeta sp.]|jgi:2-hydroxy-3-keto-5-methylthiopentenyl-1-phosphate phosphatase|nr:phosphoserine phosphatase [Sphaerochaeta sp.]
MQQKPTIAIMYDFDKTLTTKDMQEYTFIPKLGMEAPSFWAKADALAQEEEMDSILAYMKLMLDESKRRSQPIRRSDFVALGENLEFYPGVLSWFGNIDRIGQELGLVIDHYIISSGLREIIEGSAVGDRFKRIYASEYLYDENGVAVWPKLSVNYTAKTQFLFRINKGVLDVFEDKKLNNYTPEKSRPVPFTNMIYIGDGLTDVPCMKLVKYNGGKSIAVHKSGALETSHQLMREQRIDFFAEADYSADKELFSLVSTILAKMHSDNLLAAEHQRMASDAEKVLP